MEKGKNRVSEQSSSILTARVVNIRARLLGSMLIILSLLVVAGIVYSVSLFRLDQAVATLEQAVAQIQALPPEQQSAMLAETQTARRAMVEIPLVWAILLGVAVAGTTLITVRSIAWPTEQLTVAVESLASGNLEQRVELEWADEFGRLVAAFNEMADRLQASYSELERQVAERTADLEQRSSQLEAAAQVAREAASMLDLENLLSGVVTLISDRFGFYHVGIFLLDPAGKWAELQAASSEGGQRMLARRHRLAVGHEGIVGYVTGRGEPRIALDVGIDAEFFDNPDLPDTRSELAMPLRARGQIIGALDVQSREPGAFTTGDITVLQTLADQVALAISNARLFQQVQESLEAERRARGHLDREAWEQLLRTQPALVQRYDPEGILPTGGQSRDALMRAVKERKVVADEGQASPALAVPLQVRGQVIGVIDARKPKEAGGWTDEEMSVLQTLAEQLGVALDSARLHRDAQRRAAHEQMVAEITARMRETLDVDTVLQAAIREMGMALDLAKVEVRLGSEIAQSRIAPPGNGRDHNEKGNGHAGPD
jgi:GAF domain-containing protein/HAMP domain-containing protein